MLWLFCTPCLTLRCPPCPVGDGAFAKTEVSRTVISGGNGGTGANGPPLDVATSQVAANAVNPIGTAGAAATRGYVSSGVNNVTDQAAAAVTGEAQSKSQGLCVQGFHAPHLLTHIMHP